MTSTNDKEWKSIKEIADELGVSKQAIFKKVKREPLSINLNGLMDVIDGRLMVNVDGEKIIKETFERQPTTVNRQPLVDGENPMESDFLKKDRQPSTVNRQPVVDGENPMESDFLEKDRQPSTVNRQPVQQVVDAQMFESFNDELTLLKATIDTLQGQLKVKDEQIERLTSELAGEREHSRKASDRLAILADQSQKLQLAQMQQQLIEAKEEAQKKPSFWQRFFGK